jgi:ribosomal protein S18 acetylase RimI-like enzyme
MSVTIATATSPDDFQAFAGLVRDYVDWCRIRYQADSWFVDQIFSQQSLDSELADLSAYYVAPNGKALLAKENGQSCGAGAYRRLSDRICEMKRVFVPDRFRGRGTGRQLCEALIAAARLEGFELMRLDTASLLKEAIGLYRSMGFRGCAPYRKYPEKLMPHIVFMELPLRP